MSTTLESGRSAAEELERIEQAITDRIIFNPHLLPETQALSVGSVLNGRRKRPVRDTLLQQHEISRLLDRYTEECLYLDKLLNVSAKSVDVAKEPTHPAVLRQKDITSLVGAKGAAATKEVFNAFYEQVNKTKEFHQRYPDEPLDDLSRAFKMRRTLINEYRDQTDGQIPEFAVSLTSTDKLLSSFTADVQIDSLFSGEEYFGRFLDLLEFHERFINLSFVFSKSLNYVAYLDIFSSFEFKDIYPQKRLSDAKYFEYIAGLDQYLTGFFKKTRMLARPETILAKIDQDFEGLYKSQSIAWAQQPHTPDGASDPLFCKPCSKLFASEGVFKGHLNGKQHKRNANAIENTNESTAGSAPQNQNNAPASNTVGRHKLCILHEYRIKEVVNFLEKTIKDTKANIERRQALTDKERFEETLMLEREAIGDGDNLDDDDDYNIELGSDEEQDTANTYNPLKLPIGWDGKPIPFWLWKLQGLGIQHTCEICGNYTYMGRKAFETHFMDTRHTHGLKCLGIESSVLFKGITSISEAQALWENIKKQNKSQNNKVDNAIEVEDDEGNVMSQKVYNDLKKQGLI